MGGYAAWQGGCVGMLGGQTEATEHPSGEGAQKATYGVSWVFEPEPVLWVPQLPLVY